jgi:hypothetical protein
MAPRKLAPSAAPLPSILGALKASERGEGHIEKHHHHQADREADGPINWFAVSTNGVAGILRAQMVQLD